MFFFFALFHDLPIINRAAVKCDVGGPAKPVAPSAAPPNAQATPPEMINTFITVVVVVVQIQFKRSHENHSKIVE